MTDVQDPADQVMVMGPGEPNASAEARHVAQEIKSRYFYYVDTKQWSKLRALFLDDTRFEGWTFPGEGPDNFVKGVVSLLEGASSVHQGYMPSVWEKSESAVRARWTMYDYLSWPEGTRTIRGVSDPALSGIRGYGYYEDEYVLTPNGWRIGFTRLTRLRVDFLYGARHENSVGTTAPDLTWIPD